MNTVQGKKTESSKWDWVIQSFYFAIPFTGILGILEEYGINHLPLSYAILLAIPVAAGAWLMNFLTSKRNMKTRLIVAAILIILVVGFSIAIRFAG